MNLVCPA